MTSKGIDFKHWTNATAEMPWGVQRAFVTALEAVRDGQIKMVYGTDSYNGSPCLVNAINQMISLDANASPATFASEVVRSFDVVNRAMFELYGTSAGFHERYVTTASAEVLLHNFGELKPESVFEAPDVAAAIATSPYTEKSDTELAQEWLDANKNLADEKPCDIADANSPDFLDKVNAFVDAVGEAIDSKTKD